MHVVMGSGRLIAGRYRLQGPIGRGAMGIVWRGRDELLARDVAVKEVQITAHASPTEAEVIYQRTLREARTAARLSHPGVVTVFDVVEENGSPWIVMELVSARSLDRVITEDGPLPPLEAAELGACLVGALASAHSAGVLHRDVKPSNVLVTDDGKAVLTDFGIATFTSEVGNTQVGMVLGTPGFTAPERVRGGAATPASDLWSLGATLYAAVEGRGPFDRIGGATAITVAIAKEDAPRAPSAGPLGPVIDALLSRDPGTRPDATTAARLLAAATTEASAARAASTRTASASAAGDRAGRDRAAGDRAGRDYETGERVAAAGAAAADAAAASPVARPADFLDPPVYAALSMPDLASPADSVRSGPLPLVAAGQFADVVTGGTAGPDAVNELHAGAGLDAVGLATISPAAYSGAVGRDSTGPAAAMLNAASPDAATTDCADLGTNAVSTEGLPRAQASHGDDSDPVLWEPVKPGPGGYGSGGSGSGGAGLAGTGTSAGTSGTGAVGLADSGDGGHDGGIRSLWRGGPAKPDSGRWRLILAGAGIAAIALAAFIGWDIYSHTQTTQALGSPALPGISVPGSSDSVHPGPSGSGTVGHDSGGTPGAGGSGPTTSAGVGTPNSGPSGKQGSSASPNPGSPGSSSGPSSSSSPSISPSSSPSATGPVLPLGYVWHRFTAAKMSSTAGFEIGVPALWGQSVTGQSAYLSQPVTNFHLTVNLAPWTDATPLAQAQYLQAKYAKADAGYKELTLGEIGFKAVGGFKAVPAAEVKFRWTKPIVGTVTQLIVLVDLTTKSGVQPFTFTLWAPAATFSVANGIFETAMTTFRPLPS